MEKVNDTVFGEVEFKYGWIKNEIVNLWDNNFNLVIKAVAYKGSKITELQKESYIWFKENLQNISKESYEVCSKYIFEKYGNSNIKDIVKPKRIIFEEDGSCGILCDFELDIEEGLVIIVKPKYKVGPQDIFL